MAKRLTEKQKKELVKGFIDGKTIEILSKQFGFTSRTIIKNIKNNLGEQKFTS